MTTDDEQGPELPLRATSIAAVYLVEQPDELAGAIANLKLGTGPLAIDAERASGFKYSNRAYLIQLHRTGSDVFLIDPINLSEEQSWKDLQAFANEQTWILHAATQDLSCLADVGLRPKQIVDTELGSRILGLPRVGLGAVCEQFLGFRLAKEHSAADWSIRPLPNNWLNYAALDVDVLPALAKVLEEKLTEAGKTEWASQEFNALLSFEPKAAKPDKWRGMSGIFALKDAERLAIARELWHARDQLGKKLDVSPSRLIPDSSIIAAASSKVRSKSELASLSAFSGRASRTYLDTWWEAYQAGLNSNDLPPLKVPNVGIPNHRNWPNRFPEADTRLQALKQVMSEISELNQIPAENALQPDLLRRVAWEPSDDIASQLACLGARPWQVKLVAEKIILALSQIALGTPEAS